MKVRHLDQKGHQLTQLVVEMVWPLSDTCVCVCVLCVCYPQSISVQPRSNLHHPINLYIISNRSRQSNIQSSHSTPATNRSGGWHSIISRDRLNGGWRDSVGETIQHGVFVLIVVVTVVGIGELTKERGRLSHLQIHSCLLRCLYWDLLQCLYWDLLRCLYMFVLRFVTMFVCVCIEIC